MRDERSTGVQLGVLTGGKVVANTAMRWVGPFLPTLERAFGVSTSTLTTVMGVAELGGLTTIATGHVLDRGHRRRTYLAGLVLVGVASLIALIGSIASFAVAFALVVIGVGNLTVAGHAWISDRVPYRTRGRALGTFETAWALSLLLGATGLAALDHRVRVAGTVRRPRHRIGRRLHCGRHVREPGSDPGSSRRATGGTDARHGVDDPVRVGADRRVRHLRLRRLRRVARRRAWRVDGGTRARRHRVRSRRVGRERVRRGVLRSDRLAALCAHRALRTRHRVGDRGGRRVVGVARHHRADRVPDRVRVRVRHVVVARDGGGTTGAAGERSGSATRSGLSPDRPPCSAAGCSTTASESAGRSSCQSLRPESPPRSSWRA